MGNFQHADPPSLQIHPVPILSDFIHRPRMSEMIARFPNDPRFLILRINIEHSEPDSVNEGNVHINGRSMNGM